MSNPDSKAKAYMIRSPISTVEINEEVCDGCNQCVEVCPMDVFAASPEKGKPPIVAYPDECWFEGSCLLHCHLLEKGAIKLRTPLSMKVSVKRG